MNVEEAKTMEVRAREAKVREIKVRDVNPKRPMSLPWRLMPGRLRIRPPGDNIRDVNVEGCYCREIPW